MASIKAYETARGIRYRVDYVKPDGKNTTKRGFKRKPQAEEWANRNAVSIADGDWVDPTKGAAKLHEVAEDWLVLNELLKPSSTDMNLTIWRGTVKPYWGDRKVKDITHREVQRWVSGMGYSPSWVRNCHSVLCQILDVAVKDQRVKKNVARGVRLPRKVKTVHVYLTMQELKDLADECVRHGEIVMLLGTTGLRWGELAALRPRDLDPLNNRIHVRRNAVYLDNEKRWHFNTTLKNHKRRSVAVPKAVMDQVLAVASHRRRDELIWQTRDGTPMHSPGHRTWFDGAVKRMQASAKQAIDEAKAAGLPEPRAFERITPHGLRHVAAGLLVNAGANVKVVQTQLGHADAAETLNTYADLFPDMLDEVAETMDGMIAEVVDISQAPSVLRQEGGGKAV